MCFRLLSDILKETSEEIEEIEYLTDGSWRPIRDEKERDRERERSNTPEYPVVDICKWLTLSIPPVAADVSSCVNRYAGAFLKWPQCAQAFPRPTAIRRPTAAPA